MPNSINESAKRENRIRLTKRAVDSLACAPTAAVRYDDKLAGFGVRVMPSGRRFYFVRYRNKHGRSRWFTIGEHGKVTAEAARTMAQRILQTVAVDGRDPSGEREAFRAAPTVNDLLDRYIAEHVEQKNRPTTRAAFKAIVERDIRPELGQLKVAAVTRQDMYRFHGARSGTPRQANLILAVCSKAFGLAELWEMRPEGRPETRARTPCTFRRGCRGSTSSVRGRRCKPREWEAPDPRTETADRQRRNSGARGRRHGRANWQIPTWPRWQARARLCPHR
jgi:hypothetical protein